MALKKCILAVGLLLALSAAPAQGRIFDCAMRLVAVLSGIQEVAGGDPAAAGVAVFYLRTHRDRRFGEVRQAKYAVTITGLAADPVAMHIHSGAFGQNGAVEIALTCTWTILTGASPNTRICEGRITLPAELTKLTSVNADPPAFYVNVHTAAFPGGAARGQLIFDGTASNYIPGRIIPTTTLL